jgi:hypothetical protein
MMTLAAHFVVRASSFFAARDKRLVSRTVRMPMPDWHWYTPGPGPQCAVCLDQHERLLMPYSLYFAANLAQQRLNLRAQVVQPDRSAKFASPRGVYIGLISRSC